MAARMLYVKHQEKIKKARTSIMQKQRGKRLRRELRDQEKSKGCNC